jgi:hypothetical protein
MSRPVQNNKTKELLNSKREKKKKKFIPEGSYGTQGKVPTGRRTHLRVHVKNQNQLLIKSFSKLPNRTNSIELFLRLFQKRIARMQSWLVNLVSVVCIRT